MKEKIKTSDGKEFPATNEGLQEAIDSINLCDTCMRHNKDCTHFVNCSEDVLNGVVTNCDDYMNQVQCKKGEINES